MAAFFCANFRSLLAKTYESMEYSVHTLEQLRNGELAGIKRLELSENLTVFPKEIYRLSDSLEILDLSSNQLDDLPSDLAENLPNLKIFFASNNVFKHVPPVLGQCEQLEMIGFKHNQIMSMAEDCLPEKLRWLILTDNQLDSLPDAIGQCTRLEKLALAGNRLTSLPDSMSMLRHLALVRISANRLTRFPDVLLTLPKLAWLAFSGNPFCPERQTHLEFPLLPSEHLALKEVLGNGASGIISRAQCASGYKGFPDNVAVKVFRGEVTSDGYPADELDACLSVGSHPNLVNALAHVQEPEMSALVMTLIPSDYKNLGQPPSLQTCTRDTFTQGQSFTKGEVDHLVSQIESVVRHLEDKQVCHGDLYAHNVLVRPDGHLLFGDFGAASKYDNLSTRQKEGVRTIERRALSYFIEDMQSLIVGSTGMGVTNRPKENVIM
ncbi:leucine-rich repeat-containing protein kinase family protein [Marinomonas mediterranea]|jgi:Leucine-rich repeat (LRR) protein|uniref:Serine/threonine protein kinase n=1 Tax=Marinomonas mediterranea (strain ATCC 700492 / JCM 21426 / NBRC 103028 / MMB-1) TaxID=717774 RepID=F2JUF5_MARM1|nr:leucine-rich repeat-containing protein kinase family protein [Marinomonas mediterranea]ADZ92774.1 serine/threonine protein kinase [Marinomonas mediterranea MMB-1]